MRREVYLDNAATSFPKPPATYDAVDAFMRTCGGNPGRGLYPRAVEAEELIDATRANLGRLFNVPDVSRIVFTCNSTEALNEAIKGVLQPGDHVLITSLEHNAVIRPVHHLETTRGVRVDVVEATPDGRVLVEAVYRKLRDDTRLVCCVHGSNVLGTVAPIRAIQAAAREAGAVLLVDASQTAGAWPIDLEAMGIDLFAFTGHKSLFGATGTGGLIIREGLDLEPLKEGGTGSVSESPDQPDFLPDRYESGTPNTFGLAGLNAGVKFLLETGVDKVHAHEVRLARILRDGLAGIDGITLYGPADFDDRLGIMSFNFQALDPTEACQVLGRKLGIAARCGLHCAPLTHRMLGTEKRGAVRFSVGYFLTDDDVHEAIGAVEQVSATLYRRC